MTRALLALLWLAVAVAPASAGSVTVVTVGDADLQATVSKQVEGWLTGHGHTLAGALPVEAISTLQNCMTMDDQGCARGVVDAQAKGESLLYVQGIRSRVNNAIVFNISWFPKGKEPIGMRRACEDCSADLMRSTVEEMLGMIIGASNIERGRLSLHSNPEGMTVLLDNDNIGVTPLEREVAAGQHTIVLMHRGQRVGERTLKIHPEVTAEITIPVTLPPETTTSDHGGSPLVGGLVMGLGAAAIATGIALYVTSEEDTGEKLYYRDTKALGIGVAAGGAVIAGLGVWLYLRARSSSDDAPDSGPTVSLTSTAGVIGWSRAF